MSAGDEAVAYDASRAMVEAKAATERPSEVLAQALDHMLDQSFAELNELKTVLRPYTFPEPDSQPAPLASAENHSPHQQSIWAQVNRIQILNGEIDALRRRVEA